MINWSILGFHMTSRPPCWCPDQILREFNSIIMQTLTFVFVEKHGCWSREWKPAIYQAIIRHSILFNYGSVHICENSNTIRSVRQNGAILCGCHDYHHHHVLEARRELGIASENRRRQIQTFAYKAIRSFICSYHHALAILFNYRCRHCSCFKQPLWGCLK